MEKYKVEQLMERMPQGVDAGIVCGEANRRYLLGFASSAGTLFVTREKAYFIIDFRYIEAARKLVKGCEVIMQENLNQQIGELVKKHGTTTVGLENAYATMAFAAQMEEAVKPAEVLKTTAFDDAVMEMRKIKTEDELRRMREAQRMTDETFDYILKRIEPGMTDVEVALDMEFFMRRMGAEGVSFDFIVASGKNSSVPHAEPGQTVIQKGDFLTMDFGALVDGYHSDMTRTVGIGSVSDKQRRVYDTVLKAQTAALAAIKPGMVCSEVDKVARDIINAAGYEGRFGHGLGHALGIEIHESPRFSQVCDELVRPGLVMTVEPGVYLEGEFGVRIEDMGVVTEDGFENFTKSPKELILL